VRMAVDVGASVTNGRAMGNPVYVFLIELAHAGLAWVSPRQK
jgi:hypothetical protein